jgi:WS/DGAT/MGAT family acyltransferase
MTRRLSILDLAFFAVETPARPMNVGPLLVLAPPARAGTRFADTLYAAMLECPAAPPFNLRLRMSPVAPPALVPDPNFDLARRVHRLRLRKPGTMAALLDKVCELHPQPLDRSCPLWAFYLIEGLEGGRVALYAKMHHGVVDGAAFVRILSHWLATSPKERAVRAMWEGTPPVQRHREPVSLPQRAGKALRAGAEAAKTCASLSQRLWRQSRSAIGLDSGTPLPFSHTPAVLSAAPSAMRSFAFCSLPLAQMKAVGKTREATVNDVLLTVIDMAVRRYLARLGRAPDAPLVADMPVALGGGSGGNRIAMLPIRLGKAHDAPAARLQAVRDHTRDVKGHVRQGRSAADAAVLESVITHALPSLFERVKLDQVPLLANMVVSNPFGFAEPRYLMGAEVEACLPVSVVAPGQVLNITSVNYVDRLQIAFIAIGGAVPEIDRLARDTEEAFATLAGALQGRSQRRAVATNKARQRAKRGGTPRAARAARGKRAASVAA